MLLSTCNSFSLEELASYSFLAVEPDLLIRLVLVDVAGVPLVAVLGDLLLQRVLEVVELSSYSAPYCGT